MYLPDTWEAMQERAGMTQQETSEFVSELRQAFSSVQAR